jgi:hypothetical protein
MAKIYEQSSLKIFLSDYEWLPMNVSTDDKPGELSLGEHAMD